MKALTSFLFAGLLLCSFGAAAATANGVQALNGFYKGVHSLEAHFKQVQLDDDGGIVQQASGIFLLQRPARFRWEYDKPYKQMIVSDGKTFRFYDVDLAQVTIRDVNKGLRATPALLLSGGAQLNKEFEITALGEQSNLQWVRLKPRNNDGDFEEVRIGLDDNNVPARMVLDDKLGQTTLISFSDIKTNVPIDKKRFTLKIPDGVEVVDGRESAQPQ